MNCVRRHLSAIKGGRLAAACHPARVVNLMISDVPGDNPIDIASGPTVADPTTCADALAIIRRYGITVPPAVLDILESGRGESIKPGDARLARVETRLIATPQMALEAAAGVARQAGVAAHILGDAIEGEARDVGKVMAGIALQVAGRGQPFTTPCVLLSGGETTVTVRGNGRGGRNVEFLLALGVALDGHRGIHAIAGDTDGVDGQEEIAGAWLAPDSLARAWAKGIKPLVSLDNNDGHGFFDALGDSVITGPTLTNVNDFRAILVTYFFTASQGRGVLAGSHGASTSPVFRCAGASSILSPCSTGSRAGALAGQKSLGFSAVRFCVSLLTPWATGHHGAVPNLELLTSAAPFQMETIIYIIDG
jgi:glycerate 2-kinase